MAERDWKEEHDELEHTLAQATNLVAALQIVAGEVASLTPDQPIGKERRDAIVGLSDALENLVQQA